MHAKRLKASLIAVLAVLAIAGCGASPGQPARSAIGATAKLMRPAATSSMPEANGEEQDISKNPFVIWIKRNHPKTAASIINQYLATDPMPNPDPADEGQRVILRRQALETVCNELVKNLRQGLPQGLVAKVAEPGHVRVSGYQKQFGFNIDLQFDFLVQMDRSGMIWIKTPLALVKASANSALVRAFGGDLNQKAYDEIIKEMDKQGPPNARRTPGLTYTKGGLFRLDPGYAFVNMPS
ncbi:MAG: hypothetical protein ACK46X_03095 [Candidatus Sericytochromatia bacterium]